MERKPSKALTKECSASCTKYSMYGELPSLQHVAAYLIVSGWTLYLIPGALVSLDKTE